jgi:hypothetical protein
MSKEIGGLIWIRRRILVFKIKYLKKTGGINHEKEKMVEW